MNVTTPVVCSECGRTLKGTERLPHGFHVRRHNDQTGKPCRGHLFVRHTPVRSWVDDPIPGLEPEERLR